MFSKLDAPIVATLRARSIPVLRIALGIVFLWFGALKLFGVSPVVDLIRTVYPFLPYPSFLVILGIWEIAIGIGLLFKIALRMALFLLWLQMAGTLASFFLAPSLFFSAGNPFLLTAEGEFVIKNLVLIAASLVIGGHEVLPRAK